MLSRTTRSSTSRSRSSSSSSSNPNSNSDNDNDDDDDSSTNTTTNRRFIDINIVASAAPRHSAIANAFRQDRRRREELLDEDDEVRQLKSHLGGVDARRQRKQRALKERNYALVARDAARHNAFMAQFKTTAELEQQWHKAREADSAARISALVSAETTQRGSLLEEEALEYRYELFNLHLLMFGASVAMINAEHERRAQRRQREHEERQAAARTALTIAMDKEVEADRHAVEEQERDERHVLAQQALIVRKQAADEEEVRWQQEQQRIRRQQQQQLLQQQQHDAAVAAGGPAVAAPLISLLGANHPSSTISGSGSASGSFGGTSEGAAAKREKRQKQKRRAKSSASRSRNSDAHDRSLSDTLGVKYDDAEDEEEQALYRQMAALETRNELRQQRMQKQ